MGIVQFLVFDQMDYPNQRPDAEPSRRSFKNPFRDIDKMVQFWGEARGESRKISNARLKCAPISEAAESIAMAMWERMTPEHYRLVSEIDRLLVAHEEIRVAVLRETLGQIFESLNVDIKDLRTIHSVPIEALTLLLNHIIKIYNMNEADVQAAEQMVPLSERIKELASQAEKHGFGEIKVSKNMYVNERAKLAMLQTQLLGRLKLKSGTGSKFQHEWRKLKLKLESCKKDESKRKLRRIIEIKQKLKEAQETLGSNKIRGIKKKGKLRRCQSRLSSNLMNSSSHSLSTVNQDTSTENVTSGLEDGNSSCPETNDHSIQEASIDTSSWVISPTHEYYFGSSPPVIPKTTVTHEVYPKPAESKMESIDCGFEEPKKAEEQGGGWQVSTEISKSGTTDLETTKSAMGEVESTGLSSRYVSTTSSVSFTNFDDREVANVDESHGDASTIFAWTEPEKSASYCLNTGEKTSDMILDDAATEAISDAAGDGCDLARTAEESNMVVLKNDEQEVQEFSAGQDESLPNEEREVQPPRPFSLTDILDTGYSTTSNESIGIHNRNLFSCNESTWQPAFSMASAPVPLTGNHGVSGGNTKTESDNVERTGESEEIHIHAGDGNGERICDTPPAEPNEDKIDVSIKKRSYGVQQMMMNKNVMDELTNVLNRAVPSETETRDDVMTAYDSTPSTSQTDSTDVRSSGDSIVKHADDLPTSEYSSNFAIPVPPPMPPPPRETDDDFGLPYYGHTRPQRCVDDFQSATDFAGGTQVLYMRPSSATRPRSGKKNIPQRSSVNRQESESDENQTTEAPSGRDAASPGKRNDMVTLAVLAFAVGIGTLGYMTIAATGSNLFPDVVGVAGGRALNIVEKAFQVLKSLNKRL